MKKTLIFIFATLCFSGANFASTYEKVNTDRAYYLESIDLNLENIELDTNSYYCDIDCPSDDYCSGCLYSTYETEYCVGQKCRTRTKYKCNVCGDTWWIYHD